MYETAHNAAEALGLPETLPRLDPMLLDHCPPDRTGLAVAQEIAERTGAGRQTAQHCPKLLERTGRATLTLKYGDAGRPKHRYVSATRT
ncbi:hypothetical protein GCM10027073_37130 [Streptomyces chlorus]